MTFPFQSDVVGLAEAADAAGSSNFGVLRISDLSMPKRHFIQATQNSIILSASILIAADRGDDWIVLFSCFW
jgi:hypothetical protein